MSPTCTTASGTEVGVPLSRACNIARSAQPPTGGRREAMDQPTAEEALKRLEPLVGEWTLVAKPPYPLGRRRSTYQR